MFENVPFTPNLLLKYFYSKLSNVKTFSCIQGYHRTLILFNFFQYKEDSETELGSLFLPKHVHSLMNSVTKTFPNFRKPDRAIWSNVRTCWAGPTGFSTWQQRRFSVWPTGEQAHINPSKVPFLFPNISKDVCEILNQMTPINLIFF